MRWRKKDEVEKLIAKLVFWKPKAVRREAIRALGIIGDARAVKPLIKVLSSWSENLRNEAIEALVKIGAPAVEPLVKTLQEPYLATFQHETVAKILMWIGNPTVEPSTKAFTNDESLMEIRTAGVRRAAAEALGKLGDVRAVELLIEALGSHDPYVCENAAAALVKIGFQAVEPLIEILMHENAGVRVQVASILERIGWIPGNDVERTNLFTAKGKIEAVLFGQRKPRRFDKNLMISNPDVSELTIPMFNLERIEMYTESYDFHRVERFMTYAVNYIGQKHLKKHVEVHIYGDPEKLHPNLRNTFKNLCKCVNMHEKIQE